MTYVRRTKKLHAVLWVLIIVGISAGLVRASGADKRPVLLSKGRTGNFRWNVEASRDRGYQGGQRPCIGVGMSEVSSQAPPDRRFEHFSSLCASLSPQKAPNLVTESDGHARGRVTVVGMAFSPQATRALVEINNETMEIRLKLLNSVKASTAGIRQLRYAAFAIKGVACISQVTVYRESGEELFKGPLVPCNEQ